MLRVVADTNIYISALNFGGIPEELLRLAEGGAFTLCISSPILLEIARVLKQKFGWSREEAQQALRKIVRFAQLVQPEQRIRAVPHDESDNRIIECATAVTVDYILSGDHHLLDLHSYNSIAIITPKQFFDILMYEPKGLVA